MCIFAPGILLPTLACGLSDVLLQMLHAWLFFSLLFKRRQVLPEMSKVSFLLGKDSKDYFSDMCKGQRMELLKLLTEPL